jgi:hypothetical protein
MVSNDSDAISYITSPDSGMKKPFTGRDRLNLIYIFVIASAWFLLSQLDVNRFPVLVGYCIRYINVLLGVLDVGLFALLIVLIIIQLPGRGIK